LKPNYLPSPHLLLPYPLPPTLDIHLQNQPIAKANDRQNLYFKHISPSIKELSHTLHTLLTPQLFIQEYNNLY
ncbi:hypothetical protein, partial [Staphylococcus aureus]|uniref:hypothetical protein n=1 Tax=Staphylococcus aureus TaxID=1280 RepID=UPI001C92FFC7